MAEALAAAEAAPKQHLLELAEKLLGDKNVTSDMARALQSLHDDEYELLKKEDKRAFWGEAVRRELARQGVAKGALAMSGLNGGDAPTSVALAQLSKQDPKAASAVKGALSRLRTVAIECVACENLVLPRFKAEDDRCRVCGEVLPVSASYGVRDDAAHIAALLEEAIEEAPVAFQPDLAPPAWELAAPKPDVARFLKLSPENQDWDEVLAARTRVADEARRKVEEETRKKAEVEAAARRKVEDEAARKRGEEEAKKRAEEELRRKQEEAVLEQKRAEDETRRKQEEAAFAQKRAEEEILRRQEEEERLRRQESERPAIGVLTGAKAGQMVRIDDLDPKLKPSGTRPLPVITGGKAKLLVPSSTKVTINDKKVAGGIFDIVPGDIVRGLYEVDDLAVVDQTGELSGVNADPVHFKRDDAESGGPWNYWNEPVRIGSSIGSEIQVNDDGVDESHALVATRFGRVVLEDTCKDEDGIWVKGERLRSLVLRPDLKFKLGSKGPTLVVVAGQAELKEAPIASGPMKPARYVRTVLHVQTTRGEQQKVFLFARREVRFGKLFSRDEMKVENDLVIAPADDLQTVGDKQGSFSLSREGVAVRRDDRKVEMSVNDEELAPGQSALLKRQFTIEIGTGIALQGQVYRAPASVKRPEGPAQLGIEGGHPNECVKMVREGDDSGHTYVFIVRQIRLGSGATDSIQLPGIGVAPGHATIQLSRGVLQIIAPRDKHKVKLDGQILKTGVPYPLKLGAKVLLGECLLRFEVTQESDFKIQTAAVT